MAIKDEIRMSKEDMASVSVADQKLMADMEKRTLEFLNYQMRLERQIDAKKQQLINNINKGLRHPDPKVKMYAANLYNQINK